MRANYHTHSKWCHHGNGEIAEYIEEAIRHEMVEIAITEHVPHIDRFTWMSQDEFFEFNKDLDRCVAKYGDQIRVIKGFECEYIPNQTVMDLYKKYQDKYGYELFIMGQHCAGADGEINMFETKDSEAIKRYCEDVVNGLESGFFAYLAHPDVCLVDYKPGWDKTCEEGLAEVFQACSELNIPVEFNVNGLRGGREYPCKDCYALSKKYDLTYMLGSDAHAPDLLCNRDVTRAEELMKAWGLEVTEILPHR